MAGVNTGFNLLFYLTVAHQLKIKFFVIIFLSSGLLFAGFNTDIKPLLYLAVASLLNFYFVKLDSCVVVSY